MTDTQITVLRLLERYPNGITQADIVLATGMTPYAVTMAVRGLRVAGKAAASSGGGRGLAWATTEHCAIIKASTARDKAATAAAKVARRALAVSRHQQQVAADAEVNAFARPSIKRLLPAGAWCPQPLIGVVSIFAAGGGAL